MRLITFILSMYLAALAIVPCTDGMEYASSSCDTEISDHDHNHSEDHQDNCTPFCSCVCCGSMAVVTDIASMDAAKTDLVSLYQFYYSQTYSFDYSEGVWHPPALS